jgi:hypothetical protein
MPKVILKNPLVIYKFSFEQFFIRAEFSNFFQDEVCQKPLQDYF